MSIAEGFLAELEHEAAITRKTLERAPDEKLAFKPHKKSMSLGVLVGHIAEIPQWGALMIEQDVFDMNPDEYSPPNPSSVKEAVALFDKGIAAATEALKSADDPKMMAAWKMTVKGKPVMELPRIAVVRGFLMNHLVHHRAQLGVYLRLNDVPLPAIYGPSADEEGMMG